MIGEELNLNHTTVHQFVEPRSTWLYKSFMILANELGMRKICAKMVPRNLSQDQKDMRKKRCVEHFELDCK